jgi:serine/threonine-protein kinase
LVGDSLVDATAALAAVGLVLQVRDNEQSDRPEGSILKQDPEEGTRVDRGTTVGVVIAVAPPRVVPVPDLAGLPVDKAKAVLADAGLGLEVAGQRPTPGAAASVVVAQDPAAGSTLEVGSVVRVIVSTVDQSVEVPELRQQTAATAEALLGQVSLRLQVTETVPSLQPAGIVLTQNPMAGSRVPTGSVVSVVLSAGGLVVVPQVTGLSQAVAVQQLRAARLGFTSEVVVNLSRAPGTVLAQDPRAGSQVPIGTVVELMVSTRLRPPIDDRDVIIRKPFVSVEDAIVGLPPRIQ